MTHSPVEQVAQDFHVSDLGRLEPGQSIHISRLDTTIRQEDGMYIVELADSELFFRSDFEVEQYISAIDFCHGVGLDFLVPHLDVLVRTM